MIALLFVDRCKSKAEPRHITLGLSKKKKSSHIEIMKRLLRLNYTPDSQLVSFNKNRMGLPYIIQLIP